MKQRSSAEYPGRRHGVEAGFLRAPAAALQSSGDARNEQDLGTFPTGSGKPVETIENAWTGRCEDQCRGLRCEAGFGGCESGTRFVPAVDDLNIALAESVYEDAVAAAGDAESVANSKLETQSSQLAAQRACTPAFYWFP